MENQAKNQEQDFTMIQNVEQVKINETTRKLMKCHAMLMDIARFLGGFEMKESKVYTLEGETENAQNAVWKAEKEVSALMNAFSVSIMCATDYKFI